MSGGTELDRIVATIMERLTKADEAVDAALRLAKSPECAKSEGDLRIVRAGLLKAAEAGEDYIAAGAALRRWSYKMLEGVEADLARFEPKP